MRGEYCGKRVKRFDMKGSPPHARGIPIITQHSRKSTGITPACAGNTFRTAIRLALSRDHPRMRGEYQIPLYGFSLLPGSPPHARGILVLLLLRFYLPGITPACAGNTAIQRASARYHWDHPRMRGEYFKYPFQSNWYLGSPPHARGIPDFQNP